MSASATPTLYPLRARVMARFTATIDFPTPPLPLATAITLPTFARFSKSGLTGAALGAGVARTSSRIDILYSGKAASKTSRQVALMLAASGSFRLKTRLNFISDCEACRFSTIPRETMSRPSAGCITPERASIMRSVIC